MANQLLLDKLMETAKNSKVFSGFTEENLRKACEGFVDRSDDDVTKAIDNLEKENQRLETDERAKLDAVRSSQEKLIEARKAELVARKKDSIEAERLLKKLFE